jgi:hypothetical protein
VTSNEFTVGERKLAPKFVTKPDNVTIGQSFDITVEIVDAITKEKIQDIGWKVSSC